MHKKHKVYFQNVETKEIVGELPEDMRWTTKAFWHRIIELDLAVPETDFDSWEWYLYEFVPPNILIFSFNDEPYTRYD